MLYCYRRRVCYWQMLLRRCAGIVVYRSDDGRLLGSLVVNVSSSGSVPLAGYSSHTDAIQSCTPRLDLIIDTQWFSGPGGTSVPQIYSVHSAKSVDARLPMYERHTLPLATGSTRATHRSNAV